MNDRYRAEQKRCSGTVLFLCECGHATFMMAAFLFIISHTENFLIGTNEITRGPDLSYESKIIMY